MYLLRAPDVSALSGCPYYREIRDYSVGELRDCCKDLNQQAFGRGRRCLLIPDAHKLDMRTQNTLLKTLEEPPAEALLLLTGNEQGLLPTVRSRCAVIRLGETPDGEIRALLIKEGASPKNAALAAAWAGGSLGAARRYAAEEYLAFREKAVPLIEKALFAPAPFGEAASLLERKTEGKKGVSPEALLDFTEILLSYLEDGLLLKCFCVPRRNPDGEKLLKKIARCFTLGQIQGMIDMVSEKQKLLLVNRTSPALTLDALLAGLKSIE